MRRKKMHLVKERKATDLFKFGFLNYNTRQAIWTVAALIIEFAIIAMVVLLIVFALLHAIPGRKAILLKGVTDRAQIQKIINEFHLNDSLSKQLYYYLNGLFVHGSFGISATLFQGTPINSFLMERFATSFKIGIISFAMALAAGILIGVFVGLKPNSWVDNLGTIFVSAGYSIPGFVFAIFFIMAAFKTGQPFAYDVTNPITVMLPAAALMIPSIAGYVRYLRTSVNIEFNSQYVKFAKVKGCTRGRVVIKHALKPALFPVATFLPISLAFAFIGSITIENIFGVPGSGKLLIDAVLGADYDVVQAEVIIFTALIIAGFFVRDLLYAFLDPRLRV